MFFKVAIAILDAIREIVSTCFSNSSSSQYCLSCELFRTKIAIYTQALLVNNYSHNQFKKVAYSRKGKMRVVHNLKIYKENEEILRTTLY
ncbi:hypothetical protein WA1_44780 [Scytonema hofmannii PCC 7110]|uniref:Uncharacterized protein n=1 Tax=Scytonema hofmannii PCC 7110 TaxID=128403 RepID=A0A139WWH2_9CYAN|nr:hypothetical protein WA1_44780 [Scytonema hofmannii PCC 7110]